MPLLATTTMFQISRYTKLPVCVNTFHTSLAMHLNQDWRKQKGLVKNPNCAGPLVTLPDYSFKDNRPVPYGGNQLRRIKAHQEYVKKIVKLVGEVDYAVQKHAQLIKQKEQEKQKILNNKLKPKGQQLITSK